MTGRALVVRGDALQLPLPDERCGVCGGRGWHTAGGGDPMACGMCPAGEAWYGAADQGWMVDDGTCDLCVRGQCWQCTKPVEVYGDRETRLMCCCGEGYDLGRSTGGDFK